MPRRPPFRRFATLTALAIVLPATLWAVAGPVLAAGGLTMEARALLGGHARVGSWLAIEVRLANDGPPVTGELRLAGGAQGRTRFGVAVDLPTQSAKRYVLYAQPPAFGSTIAIDLVAGGTSIAKASVTYQLHDPTQLLVGIVAEKPQGIVRGLDLLPGSSGLGPALVTLGPEDLPDRLEAWGPLDRLVWQDVDTTALTPQQVSAMRGWLAGGGRVVIAGGTAGPAVLAGLPDDLLPYRPTATLDITPATLAGLLGELPVGATDLPALAGELARGRALATSGERVVAAEETYGSGSLTLLGFDPTADWIARTTAGDSLWRRLVPVRSGGGLAPADDSQILQGVSYVPALALPPIDGLLALLVGYIALIGPINYFVLRRLDRREWAWVTMPVLVVVFAAGAYGYGSLLRGSDIIVNEVAIVRGAPGTPEGFAQVYLGVFSPTRGTFQLKVPGGALLSPPINGDFIGGSDGTGAALDIMQGDPALVRDLSVSFGGFRILRAEQQVQAPQLAVELRLDGDRLIGSVKNLSGITLEKPAVVLGASVALLDDIAPGQERAVDLRLTGPQFGQPLSDRVVGQIFFGSPEAASEAGQRRLIRHAIVDQLTWDPNFGNSGQLPADGPVVLGWGTSEQVDLQIEGHEARRTANVLYYVPTTLQFQGETVFRPDLVRSSVVSVDAPFFGKDPFNVNFGQGSLTMAYRPIPFEGAFAPGRVLVAFGFSPDIGFGGAAEELVPTGPAGDGTGQPSPSPGDGPTVEPIPFDGLPELEVLDLSTGAWMAMPHLQQGRVYDLTEPARYIEPSTGTLLVRFVNEHQDGVGFGFAVQLEGEVR